MILLYQENSKMYENQPKQSKNLWKCIKTQKIKYSGTDHVQQSPPQSYVKQTSLKSHPLPRNDHQQFKQKQQSKDKQFLESNFRQTSKQKQLGQEIQNQDISPIHSNSRHSSNIAPVSIQINKNPNKNQKFRRFSVGQESVVEQIVDFKNLNHNFDRNLDIAADFQQQQQPMMMSLGSQNNNIIKQLKFSKLKQQVEKLHYLKNQLLKKLYQQSGQYQQFFKLSFHQLIAYIIEYYSTKYQEVEQQREQKKDKIDLSLQKQINNSQNKIQLQHEQQNQPTSHSGNIHMSNISHQSEDTPRFSKNMTRNRTLQLEQQNMHIQLRTQLSQKQQQIHNLQQQLFKCKLSIQTMQYTLKQLRQQNQSMNQSIFDYEQRIAQFQLQLNSKLTQKLKEQIQSHIERVKQQHMIQLQMFQKQIKQQYMGQILQLQQHIFKLQEKNKKDLQQDHRNRQLKQRQERIKTKEKQIKMKQSALDQLQIQLNAEKMEIEDKIQRVRIKQVEIKEQLDSIFLRQRHLLDKQKQTTYPYHNVQKLDRSRQRDSDMQSNKKYSHHKTGSGEQNQHSFDFRLKNLSDLNNDTGRKVSKYRAGLQTQKHDASYALTQGNRNWKYPIYNYQNGIIINKNRDGSSKSKSGSKQKKHHNLAKPYSHQNRTSQVVVKSTAANLNSSNANTKSLLSKGKEKTRLQDLGAKLQNLRQQIRKQIRQTS